MRNDEERRFKNEVFALGNWAVSFIDPRNTRVREGFLEI